MATCVRMAGVHITCCYARVKIKCVDRIVLPTDTRREVAALTPLSDKGPPVLTNPVRILIPRVDTMRRSSSMKPFDDQGDSFDLPLHKNSDRQLSQSSRRKFLQGVAALSASAGLGLIVPASALAAPQPKRGGLLKLGMGGGNTT